MIFYLCYRSAERQSALGVQCSVDRIGSSLIEQTLFKIIHYRLFGERERERERERQRQTDRDRGGRQRQRQTDRDRDNERQRQKQRQRDTETENTDN